MKSGIINSIIPDKRIQLIYNTAKIIANPYDYKISERAMIHSSPEIGNRFNIFNKQDNSEIYLASKLDCYDSSEYMQLNPILKYPKVCSYKYDELDISRVLESSGVGTCGTFVKYNNLKIDETTLIHDMGYLYGTKDPLKMYVKIVSSLDGSNLLKALEVLLVKCTSTYSLIPNLMYLVTEFYDRSLEDLENITFAKEAIAKKLAPIVGNRNRIFDEDAESKDLIASATVPFYEKKNAPEIYENNEDLILYKKAIDTGTDLYTLGIVYSIIYGAEILYHYTNINNEEIENALEYLFAINYKNSSFCEKYLYSIDTDGHICVNSKIKACFCNDPNLRFESIRLLLEGILSTTDIHSDIMKNYNYYVLPIFFARMIQSMHSYAYQISRIKHAVLLYTEAKAAGILTKEVMTKTEEFSGSIYKTDPSSGGTDDSELLDLNLDSYTDDSEAKDFVEKEKEVFDTSKENPPTLSAMDRLKKDLADSNYTYNIEYVKNTSSDKNAYNAIATSIRLITHDLTKQIKEIKTYNTGGKQGGLLVGKLDKKNLWKYKQDPHIFYNNNYKLKEMDLAFGCILDESGSMYGEKIKNGRIVMIMLHEVLNSLGINHSIIGHTSSGMYNSQIFKYFQFKEEAHYSLEKPYCLIKASDRHGNCDSGALYYMESTMKAVKNKDKIVIIFSDGQPTECTDTDLIDQVRHMEKIGIHVIGVGINFESIKEYYPDNANGRNLKEMVNIVVNILKRYVLEKKEN